VCGSLACIVSPHYLAVVVGVFGFGFPSICGAVLVFRLFIRG